MTVQNEIISDSNYISVLDHGFVGIVDHMGDDSAIVQAARVSYGKGTKSIRDDRNLIRYLMRHKHTSPFEMVEIKFHAKMPIITARQWVRHRTASINEYSGRYSEMTDEVYIPDLEQIMPQSNSNKQGREGVDVISNTDKLEVQGHFDHIHDETFWLYQVLLQNGNVDNGGAFPRSELDENNNHIFVPEEEQFPGVAKEIARMVLPLNTYTEWYWKANLHNIFHFLNLRMNPHAQYEIRVYADAMFKFVSERFPIACEAFEDYVLNAKTFSKLEMNVIKKLMNTNSDIVDLKLESSGLGKREMEEFKAKLF